MTTAEIGAGIRRFRTKTLGLGLKAFADRVGISDKTISHYERGYHSPTLFFAETIADTFGCTIDSVIGHEVRKPGAYRITHRDVVLSQDKAQCRTQGEFMRHARETRNLYATELSKLARVSNVILGKWERDMVEPHLATVIPVVDALGISIDEYIGRSGVKRR